MKSLNRYIKENKVFNPSELLIEKKSEDMKKYSPEQWLYHYFGNEYKNSGIYDMYINHITDKKYVLKDVPKKDLETWLSKLKSNSGISKIRRDRFKWRNDIYYYIYFEYDIEKDTKIDEIINQEKEKENKEEEDFRKEVDASDINKFSVSQKDIDKMKGYYNKRSDPERLVKSIKDDKKLVARWIAALKIGWSKAVDEFEYAILNKKLLTKAEIVAFKEKYGAEEEKVNDSDIKRIDKKDTDLVNSWITKSLFKYFETLSDYKITWKEKFKNAKTQEGKRAMSRNGRAWTEGFTVTVEKDGKSKDIIFDVITNEGGGLYGYSLQYTGILNLKEFKERFEREIKEI